MIDTCFPISAKKIFLSPLPKLGCGSREAADHLGSNPGLPLTSCVVWDKLFLLSVPQFSICEIGIIVVPTCEPCYKNTLVHTDTVLRTMSGTESE